MKTVIIITSAFPYYPAEQFLETEIQYWADQNDIKVILMPTSTGNGKLREIPDNIEVDLSLAKKTRKLKKLLLLVKDLFNYNTYKVAFNDNALNHKFLIFLLYYRNYKIRLVETNSFLEQKKTTNDVIFYTYWNNIQTHALQALKSAYNYKLISRIHGFDLYKERRPFDYMPLKKQFLYDIDKIYTIVNIANSYLNKVYGYPLNLLETSRLGVNDYNIIARPTDNPNELHIVSCSYIVEVKRIDKIIDALDIFSRKNRRLSVKWTHIGSGKNATKIKNYIAQKNVTFNYNFVGDLDNKNVFKFYSDYPIDVFINTSFSEGVPVSIMEAISCHIPVIAPNVGGISEIIENHYNGVLLSSRCTINEIVEALGEVEFFKRADIRNNAYETFLNKYNAVRNYPLFIDNIKNLCKEKSYAL